MRRAVMSAILLLALSASHRARGQQGEPSRDGAAALALFDEGRKLLADGDVAGACVKFQESHRMNPLPGTLLNLANCHEKLGKLSTAWGEYREALTLARVDNRADRIQFAEVRLAAIEPRLPMLVIQLGPELAGIEGLQVLRDGVVLGTASMGVRLPVDPGAHVVEARAPGRAPFRVEVQAVEGGVHTVGISGLEPVDTPAEPKPPVAVPVAPKPVVVPPPPKPTERGPSPLWISGWTVGGLGAATAIAGIIAGAYAISEESAAEERGCTDRLCFSEDALARSRHANAAATAANVLIPVGATLTATGVVLLIVAPAAPNDTGASGVALTVRGALW